MNDGLISKIECNVLRGISILGIILHNFFHWLPGIAHENEYRYVQENVDFFNHAMMNPDGNYLLHLISYYGHYGVSIFIFLSGYGLVQKYEHISSRPSGDDMEHNDGGGTETTQKDGSCGDKKRIPVLKFISSHYLKLFKIMILGYAGMMVWNLFDGGDEWKWTHIVSQLLMVNNFAQYPGDIIWPGPYWYFGLMLQLYILYRLIFYRRHWGWIFGFIVLCTCVQMVLEPDGSVLEWVRYNFVGSMLPFGMGCLYARYGRQQGKSWYFLVMIVSLILMVIGGMNFYSWFFTPVFFILFLIALIKLLPAGVSGILSYLGLISAGLFVFHPIARKLYIYTAQQGELCYGLGMYLLVSVIGAVVFFFIWKFLPSVKKRT